MPKLFTLLTTSIIFGRGVSMKSPMIQSCSSRPKSGKRSNMNCSPRRMSDMLWDHMNRNLCRKRFPENPSVICRCTFTKNCQRIWYRSLSVMTETGINSVFLEKRDTNKLKKVDLIGFLQKMTSWYYSLIISEM